MYDTINDFPFSMKWSAHAVGAGSSSSSPGSDGGSGRFRAFVQTAVAVSWSIVCARGGTSTHRLYAVPQQQRQSRTIMQPLSLSHLKRGYGLGRPAYQSKPCWNRRPTEISISGEGGKTRHSQVNDFRSSLYERRRLHSRRPVSSGKLDATTQR